MSTAQSNAVKVIALSAASIALLSACGEPKATPMDDEYAGNSGESVQSQENKSKTDGKAADNTAGGDATTKNHADDANSTTSSKQDTGNYADGDYSVNGQYGPVGEDTIDVQLTVKDQNVTAVKIVGHPFTSISKKHQNRCIDRNQHPFIIGPTLKEALERLRQSRAGRGGRQAVEGP